ncbi:hypothetical protein HB162lentus_25350 [Mammaliicoccus lentus]
MYRVCTLNSKILIHKKVWLKNNMFYDINSYQKQNILVLKLVKHLLYIEFELKRKLKTILKTDWFLVIKKGGF